MTVARRDFERAIRTVHEMNAQTGFTTERIEALMMSVVRALVDDGTVDEARLDRAIAVRRQRDAKR